MLITCSGSLEEVQNLLSTKVVTTVISFSNEIDFDSSFIEEFKIIYHYKIIVVKLLTSDVYYFYQVPRYSIIKEFVKAKNKGEYFNTFKQHLIGTAYIEELQALFILLLKDLEDEFFEVLEEISILPNN